MNKCLMCGTRVNDTQYYVQAAEDKNVLIYLCKRHGDEYMKYHRALPAKEREFEAAFEPFKYEFGELLDQRLAKIEQWVQRIETEQRANFFTVFQKLADL